MRKITILLFLSLLYLAGCVNEDFVNQAGNVREGEPAQVNLKVGVTPMGVGLKTRALKEDEENKISNLRILIFNSKGEIVTNQKYDSDPGSLLNLETVSGSGQTICMVANVMKDAVDQRLEAIATYSQLKEAMVTAEELDNGFVNHPLMMTAVEENVTIAPGSNKSQIEFKLQFLAAKLTLKVVDATPGDESVTLLGWNIIDGPARSYIFGGEEDANADERDVADDARWITSKADYSFESVNDEKTESTQTLYLLENRRGGRVQKDPYKDLTWDDENDKGKRYYSPKRATAIMIKALHAKAGESTKLVDAYIYIGENSYNDYNIMRGKHYQFTVRVTGLNEIEVDTNVDLGKSSFAVDYGDNLVMDAHPDYRAMRIHAPAGVVKMEILDSQNRNCDHKDFDATWLKISPLDLMFHQVKQTGNDAYWQQDANPESGFVRPKYIPHRSVRERLKNKEGWNDVPEGTDNDDKLSFKNATYRMCYEIDSIPFENETAVTNQTLYVYADEYLKAEGTPREAKISFSYFKKGNKSNPEVLVFDISQEGYMPIFNDSPNTGLLVLNEDGTLTNVRKKFVLEQYEEVMFALYPGIDPSLQTTRTMQFGFSEHPDKTPNVPTIGINTYDWVRNGKLATAYLVYNDVKRVDNEPVGFGKGETSNHPMFGRSGQFVIERYTGTTTGWPYYYPDLAKNIYHPIYKSSAARYCHEKNRDLNGDGFIDESEAHWYLPSVHQLSMVWIQGKKIPAEGGRIYHWTSSTKSSGDIWQPIAPFGFEQGNSNSAQVEYEYQVRCARDL